MNNLANPSPKTSRTKGLMVDIPFVLAIVCLLVFGLMMVYSTDLDASLRMNQEPGYIFQRQVIWIALGLAVAVFLSFFDYHNFEKLVVPILIIVLVGLFAVLVRNEVQFNSSRALFRGSIQPGELAKVGVILYLSVWLSRRRQNELQDMKVGLIPLLLILVFVAILIFFQPDISAAITVLALGIMMFFLGGGNWKQITALLAIVASAGLIAINVYATGRARLPISERFARPNRRLLPHSPNLEAVIKGKFFGVGLGEANTKFTGLPLPHTDSIFAVLAEETGLFGSFILIGLYLVLIWRGYKIAQKRPISSVR